MPLYRPGALGNGGPPSWNEVQGKPATYPPTIGTTADTAKAGDYQPAWGEVTDKPAVIAAGATQSEARISIGAIPEADKGTPNGVAPLDGSGIVPIEHINVSGLTYHGTWDADANDPELLDGTGSVGDFRKVSVAGTHSFGSGTYNFGVGDWVIFAAGAWQRVGVHEAVASVNGQTGAVSLSAGDVGALPDTYAPPAPAWADVTGKPDFDTLYTSKLQGTISAPIPAVYARLASDQAYANSSNLEVEWTDVIYDQFSTQSDNYTFVVPAWVTHVRATTVLAFAENNTGYRYGTIRRNGASVFSYRESPVTGHYTHLAVHTPVFPVSEGDEISVGIWQNSGGSLGIQAGSTWFQIDLFTTN